MMASRLARNTLVQSKRSLATQTAIAKKAEANPHQTSKLSNGLRVSSIDTGGAVSSVGIFIKAGPRNETYENKGVSQALRLASGLATKMNTSFSTIRNIQQHGGKVDVISNREHSIYVLQAQRSSAVEVADYALPMVDSPALKPWEVSTVPSRMAYENANLSLADIAIDLLHQAAYRDGLGNSLYAPDFMIGKHTPAMIQEFHENNYTTERSVLVGLDIDHDTLVALGEKLQLNKGVPGTKGSKYFGGDARRATGGSHTYMAVAAEAPAWTNVKEAMAAMVLQEALGVGTKVKYTAGNGILQNAAKNAGGFCSALNFAYSDSALLGAFISSDSESAGKVLEAVVAALRSVNITEEQFNAAKKSLILSQNEALIPNRLETLGSSFLYGSKDGMTVAQVADHCNNVTLSDVKAVSKRLANAKFSMGAAGNLENVPYIDQL